MPVTVSDLRAVERLQREAMDSLRRLPPQDGLAGAVEAFANAVHSIARMRIDAEADLRRWAAGRCGEPSLWRHITAAVDAEVSDGHWTPTARIVADWLVEVGESPTEDERAALVRAVDERRHAEEAEARRALSAPGIAGEPRALPVWAGVAQ